MKYREATKFFEKKVKITTLENEIFVGVITGFEDDLDTSSGKDEVELDVGEYDIGIEISDIKSIEEI